MVLKPRRGRSNSDEGAGKDPGRGDTSLEAKIGVLKDEEDEGRGRQERREVADADFSDDGDDEPLKERQRDKPGKSSALRQASGGGPSRLSLQTQLCSQSAPAPAGDAGLVWPRLSSLTLLFLCSRCTLGTTFLGTEPSPFRCLRDL